MAPENEFEPLRCDARSNGPARVLATERSGRVEASAPGSVVWVSHAGLLLRCAPEQLREVSGKKESYVVILGSLIQKVERVKAMTHVGRYAVIVLWAFKLVICKCCRVRGEIRRNIISFMVFTG